MQPPPEYKTELDSIFLLPFFLFYSKWTWSPGFLNPVQESVWPAVSWVYTLLCLFSRHGPVLVNFGSISAGKLLLMCFCLLVSLFFPIHSGGFIYGLTRKEPRLESQTW